MVGQFEKPIFIHKFRSMYSNAHEDFEKIVEQNGMDNIGKPANDSRITPFGKLIRKYFIDEIPQFYDLAIGNLSLVGIRPKTKEYWKNYSKEFKECALKYKPGLVGVHYFYLDHRDFKDIMQTEKEYLKRTEMEGKDKTDRKYLKKIFENIILNGLRSR